MHHVYARCRTEEVAAVGCGVAAHDDTCLCDVEITAETPVRFGLHELPLVMSTARRLGKGFPWTARDVEEVMTIALHVYDQVHDDAVHQPDCTVDRDGLIAFHSGGGCIVDALAEFAIDFNAWKWTLFGPRNMMSKIGRAHV